jgi:FlaA1/EpsC-like NDP-sugar epimerase
MRVLVTGATGPFGRTVCRRMYHRYRIWDPQEVADFAPSGGEGSV